MDKHDVAHYSLAAVTLGGLGAGYFLLPPTPPRWPTLTSVQAQNIVVMTKQNPIDVYCADLDCSKITLALIAGGKAKGISVHTTALLGGQNGLTVGAPTQAEADIIKHAVEEGSGGVLKVVDSVAPTATRYISFGRLGQP